MTVAKDSGRQKLEGDFAGLSFRAHEDESSGKYPVASYRLPPELRDEIKQIAADKGVSPADVARKFLEEGIRLYKEGSLILETIPNRYSLK